MKGKPGLLRLAILMSCCGMSITFVSAQTTLYVDSSAVPGGSGNSWTNAMASLADAVLQADTNQDIDTILIAKGTYYPEYIVPATSVTTARDKSFYFLRDGLALIAGYPNGGGMRNLQYNPVILSGDIGIRNDSTDNAYHVMLIIGDSTDTSGAGGTGGVGGNAGTGGIDSTGGIGGNGGTGGNAGGGGIGGNGGLDSTGGMGGNAGEGGIGGNGGIDSTGGMGGNAGEGGTGGIAGGSGIATISSTLYFDGITVNGGNANGTGFITVKGTLVSQTIGAGIYNHNYSRPFFANCTITGNSAIPAAPDAGKGGGMYNDNHSGPSLVNCIFTDNKASSGGGIYNYDYSAPSLLNCIFSGNDVVALGGGMVNSFNCSPAIVNCLFAGNAGSSVSAMFNYNNSSPTLINVSISGNKSDTGGSSIENTNASSPVISNSICYGNSSGITNDDAGSVPVITNSLIQGSADIANGNIAGNVNPLFVAPEAYANAPTTEGDYHLQSISALVNRGNNAAVPAGDTTDLAGNPRIVNDTVDMGAYEYLNNEPLPLSLLSFEAVPAEDCKALVSWQTANEQNVTQFAVEQSVDAVSYTVAASQMPVNAASENSHQALVPMSGSMNYFRLKILEEDGSYTYSKVASVSSHCSANDIVVYPNPVQSTLYIKHSAAGIDYMVLDYKGDILIKGSLINNITAIPVVKLKHGTYLLRITSENGTEGHTFKFVKL